MAAVQDESRGLGHRYYFTRFIAPVPVWCMPDMAHAYELGRQIYVDTQTDD